MSDAKAGRPDCGAPVENVTVYCRYGQVEGSVATTLSSFLDYRAVYVFLEPVPAGQRLDGFRPLWKGDDMELANWLGKPPLAIADNSNTCFLGE